MINNEQLLKLGFLNGEIQLYNQIISNGIGITPASIKQIGYDTNVYRRIKYIDDIINGAVDITTKEGVIKHQKKIYTSNRRLTISDFAVSKIKDVPRFAIIGGIKDEVYSILNSNKYTKTDGLYKVQNVTSRIIVATDKKIVLKHGYTKKIDNVLEILGKEKDTGHIVIAMDKKHCKMCNRYVILASLRVPEFHLGMVEIIAIDGTVVYVYAKDIGTKPNLTYQGGTSRVYDWGILPESINTKLLDVSKVVYGMVRGVKVYRTAANSKFSLLEVQEKKEPEIID